MLSYVPIGLACGVLSAKVGIVAKKTRSMLWCCIADVVAYVALGALPL